MLKPLWRSDSCLSDALKSSEAQTSISILSLSRSSEVKVSLNEDKLEIKPGFGGFDVADFEVHEPEREHQASLKLLSSRDLKIVRTDRSTVTPTYKFEIADPKTLLAALSSDDDAFVLKCFHHLLGYFWNARPNRSLFSDEETVKRLFGFVFTRPALAGSLRSVLCSLSILSGLDKAKETLWAIGALKIVLGEIETAEDMVMKKLMAILMRNITADSIDVYDAIHDSINLTYLFGQLNIKDDEYQLILLQFFKNIFNDSRWDVELGEVPSNDFSMLATLLESYNGDQRDATLDLLPFIFRQRRDDWQFSLVKKKVLKFCRTVLTDDTKDELFKKILAVLKSLSEDPSDCELVALEAGDELFKFLFAHRDVELVVPCLGVLVDLASCEFGCTVLSSNKFEKLLVPWILNKDQDVSTLACKGIANMIEYEPFRKDIILLNPVPDLITLALDVKKSWPLRSQALASLRKCVKNSEILCAAAITNKKIEEVLMCLKHCQGKATPAGPAAPAVEILRLFQDLFMSSQGAIALWKPDIIVFLIERLRDADVDDVTEAITDLLTVLLKDSRTAEELTELEDFPSLVLSFTDEEWHKLNTLYSLIQAFQVASYNNPRLGDYIERTGLFDGVLDLLRYHEINPVTQKAIDEIYRQNTSYKFDIYKTLGFRDKTNKFFYVFLNEKCFRSSPPLREIISQNLSPLTPVYVVDCPRPLPVSLSMDGSSTSSCLLDVDSSRTIVNVRGGSQLYGTLGDTALQRYDSAKRSFMRSFYSSDKSYTYTLASADRTGWCYERLLPDWSLYRYVQAVTQASEVSVNVDEPLSLASRVSYLSRFVCSHLQGPDPPQTRLDRRLVTLHLRDIRNQIGTNVIPLGMLRVGHKLERALLFKVLADRIDLPCRLVRSGDLCAWVEVTADNRPEVLPGAHPPDSKRATPDRNFRMTVKKMQMEQYAKLQAFPIVEEGSHPRLLVSVDRYDGKRIKYLSRRNLFVVDLMDNIGELMEIDSEEARIYCTQVD